MASLATTIAQTFDQRAAATALLVDGKSYSFRSLRQRAAGAAAVLQRRRIEPGDRVAVGLTNSLDLVVTVLGVLHSGAVLVPLNPASAADEIEYIVRDAQPRAAIVGPSHASILSSGRFLGLSWVDTTLAADPVSIPSEPADLPARAAAMIIYTSGTTGRPKGAVLSHAALLSNLTTVARAWHWTGADRLLLTLPCFHLHGLGLGILGSALAGSSVVLRPRFVIDEVLGDIERTEATMFFGVPTMYNRLVALPEAEIRRHNLRRVRLWVCGSAPLSPATFERFAQRFGQQLLDRYGMTECGFVLSAPYTRPRRAGVVGLPLPGITLKIIDQEAATLGQLVELPDGTAGEIIVQGPNLFSGYWGRPEDTERTLLDGYLRTGDLAVRESDGMIRIVGRSSVDIIKTRGFKVGAVEIEDCLQRHPDVQDSAVVGMADADQGERVVAVVVPRPGTQPTAETLRAHAQRHLAPHKVPSQFILADEIPRTGPGKVEKKEIIRRLAATNGKT